MNKYLSDQKLDHFFPILIKQNIRLVYKTYLIGWSWINFILYIKVNQNWNEIFYKFN